MGQPLISVIIPIYNTEDYLVGCFDSVLAQTYQKIEVILVDDGSTDQSGVICDKYALRDSRIRVFHIPNGGASNARNTGLEAAAGEYIMFVDADDRILPEHIQNLIPAEAEDLVCCGITEYVDGVASHRMMRTPETIERKVWMNNFWGFWRKKAIWSPCCSCYSMAIIQNHHLRFDCGLHLGEDELFNLHYFKHCRKVRFTENCTYCYERGNESSALHRYQPTRLAAVMAISKAIEDVAGMAVYPARWYYWHSAISHLQKWRKQKSGYERKEVTQALRDCFGESFFRESLPYIRSNGTLDERVETYFMRSWLHPVYKPAYSVLTFAARIKNRFLKRKPKTEDTL